MIRRLAFRLFLLLPETGLGLCCLRYSLRPSRRGAR